jgi:outer membrane protein
MKTYTLFLSVLAALGAFLLPAHADNPIRVITVDMTYLYENYHRTQEAQARFQSSIERAQRETQKLMEEGNEMVERYQEIIEQTNNPALSDAARQEAQQEAQEMVEAIREKERELQQFQNNTRRSLEQRQRNHRELMLDEIKEVVMAEASERSATLVFDTSGATLIGVPTLIYADSSYDITDVVLEEINREETE